MYEEFLKICKSDSGNLMLKRYLASEEHALKQSIEEYTGIVVLTRNDLCVVDFMLKNNINKDSRPRCQVCSSLTALSFNKVTNNSESPEFRKTCSRACNSKVQSPGAIAKIKESLKKHYSNESNRKKLSDTLKKSLSTSVQQERIKVSTERRLKTMAANNSFKAIGESIKSNYAAMSDEERFNHFAKSYANRKSDIDAGLRSALTKSMSEAKSYVETLVKSNNITNRFELARALNISYSHIGKILSRIGCSRDYLLTKPFSSIAEKELSDFINSIGPFEVLQNTRKVITPMELDLYIPEKSFAIEFNGAWCHGSEYGKDKHYHIDKSNKCADLGITLLHIWDDEWADKRSIIESMIKVRLGYATTVGSRQCVVKSLSTTDKPIFFNENHIQGDTHSNVAYGLYFNDELVQAMSFAKPRFNKKYDWEVIRMATKLNHVVIGGMSKLLKHFRLKHDGSIITYSEVRLNNKEPAYKNNFKLVTKTEPGFFVTYNGIKYGRQYVMKHKLIERHKEKYDYSKSAFENMIALGYNVVWDCGQWVYELT